MRLRLRRFLPIGLAAVLLLCSAAGRYGRAQTVDRQVRHPSRALTQFAFDHWDDRQGLPTPQIQAITQTTDGYLWLGTREGLERFDGVEFTTFDGRTHPELKRAYMWALIADRNGGLWGGTEFTGVFRMKDNVVTRYDTLKGLPSNHVTTLLQDRTGTVWAGTVKGLAQIRSGRAHVIVHRGLTRPIRALAQDSAGRIWIAADSAVWILSKTGYQEVRDSLNRPFSIAKLHASRRGGMWMSGHGRVFYYEGGHATYPGGQPEPLKGGIWDLQEDDTGDLWLGGGFGIARVSNGMLQIMNHPNGSTEMVTRLELDREGSLWVGTMGEGLFRIRATPIVSIGPPEGLGSKATSAIARDRSGVMWVGSYGSGVDRITNSVVTKLTTEAGQLPNNAVFEIAPTRDGSVWVGTAQGAARIRGSHSEVFGAQVLPVQVRAIAEDSAGTLWFGTNKGIRTFGSKPDRSYTAEDGLASNLVLDMLTTRDGAVWIGTISGLSRLKGGNLHTFGPRDGIPHEEAGVLYQGADGVLWVVTRGGLVRYANNKFFTYSAANGLCASEIGSVVEDRTGQIWLGSSIGIIRLYRSQLDSVAAGHSVTLDCRIFDRADGMRARESGGNAVMHSDGRLWFPTSNGVAVVDPVEGATLAAPPVVIEDISDARRRYVGTDPEIPPATGI